jgi:hypothetical protein
LRHVHDDVVTPGSVDPNGRTANMLAAPSAAVNGFSAMFADC